MIAWFLSFLLFLLSSCGGGGGGASTSGPILPAPTPRPGIHVGYYLGCVTNMLEQVGHIDLWWASGACASSGVWWLDMAQELQAARGAGVKVVVLAAWPSMTNGPNANAEMEFQLTKLAATGQLAGWDAIMVYPQDEPDKNGVSEAQMNAIDANLRGIFTRVPALANAKIGVIYNCRNAINGNHPGLTSVDWIGCDDYDAGCGALSELDAIPLRSGQRKMSVPGGSYGQDPACFISHAWSHPEVVAVIPFLWQSVPGITGIRENGLKKLYCEMGQTILRDGAAPTCS